MSEAGRESAHQWRIAIVVALITAGATIAAAFIANSAGVISVEVRPPSDPGVPVAARSSATTTTNPTVVVEPTPSGGARRESGSRPITLATGYGVDFDNLDNPNWLVHDGPAGSTAGEGSDVSWGYGSLPPFLSFSVDGAPVEGDVSRSTCADTTGYSGDDIDKADLIVGEKICVRTDEKRFAMLEIASVKTGAITFGVTVWDPPFEE